MRRGFTHFFVFAGAGVGVATLACTPFSGAENESTPLDAAAADSSSADGGPDVSNPDTGSADACADLPYPADASLVMCGAPTVFCNLGEKCCVTEGTCLIPNKNCVSTEVDCASADNCSNGMKCCRTGSANGSRCMTTCSDKVLCTRSSHCNQAANEVCAPPKSFATEPWWYCQPAHCE